MTPQARRRLASLSFLGLAACSSAPAVSSATQADPVAEATSRTAHATADSAEAAAKQKEWRRSMATMHAPKTGCFVATEPSTTWEEVPCGAAPTEPHPIPESLLSAASDARTGDVAPLAAPHLLPQLINGSNDYSATVSGLLSAATGSFPFESGGTSESDTTSGAVQQGANSYTLQLNTNLFVSPACNGQSGCRGWEQMFYEALEKQAFFEFSLVGFTGKCQAPYSLSYTTKGGTQVCYYNTNVSSPPAVAASSLSSLEMTGSTTTVNGVSTDHLSVFANGKIYTLNEPSVLGLGSGWTNAEFNVYGDMNSTQASFNSATALEVQVETTVQGGSTAAPTCSGSANAGWYTVESNTLSLNGACCAFGGPVTGIRFSESTVAGAASTFLCPPAPKCTYAFSCANAGQIAVTCTPDTNSPSDSITIYNVGGGQRTQLADDTFSSTSPAPTQVATVSTFLSGATTETLEGCTNTTWGGQICDPPSPPIATPSCVGVSCGPNGATWDAAGGCSPPCQPGTCSTLGKDCGSWADGCGGEVTCGSCPSTMVCQTGVCVGSGGSSGNFCADCRKTGGICTTSQGKSTCVHE